MAGKDNDNVIEERKNEILGIMLIALGILSGIALFTSQAGVLGRILGKFYQQGSGKGAYLVPFLLVIWGITLIRLKGLAITGRLWGFIITLIILLTLYHTYSYSLQPVKSALMGKGGGLIGGSLTWLFMKLFGTTGTYVIQGAILLIGILLWADIFLSSMYDNCKSIMINCWNSLKERKSFFGNEEEEIIIETGEEREEEIEDFYYDGEIAAVSSQLTEDEINGAGTEEKEAGDTNSAGSQKSDSGEDHDYILPQLNLLKGSRSKKINYEKKNQLLEDTLKSFGVEARVIKVSHGPTITRYEVQPASGVKVSKIVNLADDISLALAAPEVRIEAPIPGKAAVGIEVPHSGNNLVRLRDVLVTKRYQQSTSKLTLALGKGIDGKPVVTELEKMPHLLVAGATGSGKSMCINTIITSILYKATPEEVKLILIDPKKVELSHYEGLPHLFTPVVTDPKKAANVLKLVVEEMENRYDLFSESGTRGINSYNKQVSEEDRLPYVVVIIDELSDLMMVAASEVEDNICRLAQMSRAAGIHLVIATQRPSVDVITGLIKANIPSRISFAVSSQTDSRTILDMGGAEKLLGNGDMLFAPVSNKKPMRVQGSYLENGEISNIVDFVKNQADPDFEFKQDELQKVDLTIDDEKDELYEEAVKLVVNYRASISMLQRRLHIGHSRAARLIDHMEEEGIVGPYAGSKPRDVLISKEELSEYIDIDDGEIQESEEEEDE